jgi:hypothetical protein
VTHVFLSLLVACAAEPPPPSPLSAAPPPIPADAPKVDTMLGQVPGVKYIGEWTSAGCEGRTFARNLTFFENGEYAAMDLVSPCPAGTVCAWSGLVAYVGIWKQDGTKLLLREIGAPTAPGSPHPTEVQATVDGQLVENGCTYSPGLTVPPGYTEDQVRPRFPGSR